uniref:Uncharacterized protein n=1 Tax=Timema monikensis TaxID=170555 RepID=A0A7R9E7P2_9NEOP|nr:unnamed protein product [Timema monikensis]
METVDGASYRTEMKHRLQNKINTTSQCSTKDGDEPPRVPRFKVAMLGASGVGKTALTCQFTTSEYICAYDTSLDKSVPGQRIEPRPPAQKSDTLDRQVTVTR